MDIIDVIGSAQKVSINLDAKAKVWQQVVVLLELHKNGLLTKEQFLNEYRRVTSLLVNGLMRDYSHVLSKFVDGVEKLFPELIKR